MAKLILVPTPIGNLEDITLRALRVLKEADFILAEDTRTTGMLLKHYQIESKMFSHHKFNEHNTVEKITQRIKGGETAAMVSDAGTPGISDPGYLLVNHCITNGIEVECLPGATALIPAIVMAGLPNDRFCFEGFLPPKKGRQKKLTALQQEERTMVFYESPHRLVKTLNQSAEFFGLERKAAVCRELSKFYEEIKRGSLEELIKYYTDHPPKGEIVLVIEGNREQ
ncbi:16S rRNA (cytidine(1402)-2'-O)-methyltransferase [Alkalitalea saponilacus]|uniref:Ribosomal RNA small subunit methyltransferase I n=1 Tax=Alkalitalea saponilacus TaxID=889453 RepID=A0A1T5HFF3_9BACT|nr:16S rRNA (cytidine(1402)-2'-O)-methyltransferase [Alkalitalea saponilacus]ASB48094.1 16S rRNA (cytidine(1402)-2'-O)-methyltransferase [Alkalitalea saponilacus]SKC19443.1 16S rRNA (cytidine1402-2'-O)-methyltransferase [Alkalitalea saponilacus]